MSSTPYIAGVAGGERCVRVLGGVVEIPIGELLSIDEAREDWRKLSVDNPARAAAFRSGGSRYVFQLTERVSSLEIGDGVARYPIGAARVYRSRLAGKKYMLADERVTLPRGPLLPYCGQPFEFQARAVEALASNTMGICVAPCGAGKGEILSALVGLLGRTTLIVVDSLDQATELSERVPRRLGITVGMIGGGERRIERVTIALRQALDDATVADIASIFEVVIRDECHHAAAASELTLWRRLHARYWYAFTATPRADELAPFVGHHFGPVVATVTRAELVAAGRSVDPSIIEVVTDFVAAYADREDWAPLLAALESDSARNSLIVDTVVREGEEQLSAVLTGRIEHAVALGAELRARGQRVEVLSSKRTKRDRTAAIDAARAGDLDVIIGTQLLDEAIDIARLARVHLVWPSKAEGRLIQRVGRALRPMAGKGTPRIYDYVDARVGPLRNQARIRREVYERTWPTAGGLP